jgi:ribosomal-protein-alanine N-acetyltransferase
MRLKMPFSTTTPFDSIAPVQMTAQHLSEVLSVEQSAYSHPWTLGNFGDSIASGYHMPVWFQDQHLLGYLVAMRGADELHLLNITVAPGFRRRGWGGHMLRTLIDWARERGVHAIWLEVRASNQAGIALYQAHGFDLQGERKNYYPLSSNQREDAVVMGLQW